MREYFLVLFLISNSNIRGAKSICDNQLTCGDCISYENSVCVWCSAENHNGPRCASKGVLKSWCGVSIYDPSHSIINLKEEDLRAASRMNSLPAIQLKPQRLKIRARAGVPVSFKFWYQPATDYALDVYFLMDTSYTMKDHKQKLQNQGHLLQKSLSSFTNNVQLGFGSFIEKPALPYTAPDQHAYSFKNNLKLTANMDSFETSINHIRFGSNWEDPEAGFDGLMQAMVCSDLIGWRNESRRVIVLCTDSTYHSAGDGKMVGAIKPNDMKCHMINNEYTEALTMDYPSVSQISKVARRESIKIIFAATRDMENVYRKVANKIHGSAFHFLDNDASNIAEYIKTDYIDLAQNLRLDTSNVPDYIELTLNPPCDLEDNKNCKIKHHKILAIDVKLMVKYCPRDKRINDIVDIRLKGLKEKIRIELELDCKCECENDQKNINNSSKCNNKGIFQCGICKCNKNSYGDKCDCDGTSAAKDMDKCHAQNDTVPCSGRGICRCGKCIECGDRYSGMFCELDDESCPQVRGEMCAGRGRCSGGRCICHDKARWSGADCDCALETKTCIAPQSNEVCSGNGHCICGKCLCLDSSGSNNTDVFCDNCEGCAERRCQEIDKFALCTYNETCSERLNDTDTQVQFVDENEIGSAWEMAKWCSAPLEDRCSLVYKYQYDRYTKKLLLVIQKQKVCIPSPIIWIPVCSAIGGVLLIGILTAVIWKVCVDVHDDREYKRFVLQHEANGTEVQNDLYRPPETKFVNPAFDPQT